MSLIKLSYFRYLWGLFSGIVKAFISHNKTDKDQARSLAMALVEQGADVWFDEWNMRPGDSLVGGIEEGVSSANTFILVWSSSAQKSNWVGTELRAYLRRRVDDGSPSYRAGDVG